jgi:hypothetical protein
VTLRLETLSVETARELMDFGGGAMSPGLATEQLEGAVSVHNLLAREGFAYLADEVGMGKTYVALGAVALVRFFHPHLRVLYIAPRENIQTKWRKELQNFVRNNWKWVDQRVKDFEQAPAVDVALCSNMADWARQAVRAPDRDFLVRMTSFSFPLSDDTDLWKRKRDEIRNLALFVDPGDLDLRDKDSFKISYAQAVNVLLPHYDLVVVDEAHNFKHGRKSGAARNRVLRNVLGFGDEGTGTRLAGYGRRADRVLFLSATPLESDYEELWRQLDLFGFGERAPKLRDSALGDAEKKAEVSRFLVRRLTGLRIGDKLHTKNMYRREWRGGGCARHDEALEVPDARQKLVVALVQKKVAEILRDVRFGACFQMGMLASFESFFRTAKVKTAEDTGNFDATEQTEDELEKEGIDTSAIDQLARSYRREFKEALPHPKMDALVESLAGGIGSGEKTLVFVRRVKSVDEIVEKLCRKYDAWLRTALLEKVPAFLHEELKSAWNAYEEERGTKSRRSQVERDEIDSAEADVEEGLLFQPQEEDDPGGNDTFFAWFFRGEGPEGWLSGAAFRKNRLMGTGSAYSTFFEDNLIGAILGDPEDTLASLASVLGKSEAECVSRLRNLAFTTFHRASRQKRFPRLPVFHAYQAAGLVLLASSKEAIASEAKIVLRERYPGAALQPEFEVPSGFPEPREFVNTRTFFAELRRRPELRGELWPASAKADFRDRFREREQRRELLSGTARLGHAFLDLWALAMARTGSLKRGAQEKTGERTEALIGDYLDLLESQRGQRGFHAYRELFEVAANHELILSVNFSEVIELPLNELSKLFGRALAKQNPIGGMFGGVNATLVRQFRMPGYPLVLVTTEVLQEGEDLHTFCSRVVHYGITWTPSGMEQRTGRVDRIGSLAHRNLDGRPALVPEELLQVYYPYLGDTVERLQVERLLEKMNRFLRMIHRTGEEGEESRIFTKTEFLRRRDTAQITERLESSFPVRKDTLLGARPEIGNPDADLRLAREDLRRVAGEIARRVRIDWDEQGNDTAMYGTAFVEHERLLIADDSRKVGEDGIRQQPFAFHLRSAGMLRSPVLHCVSPVGDVRDTEPTRIIEFQEELRGVKLSEVSASEANTYTLMAEGDVIFTRESAAVEDVFDLLERVAVGADLVERTLLGGEDAAIEKFREDLRLEAERGRD